MDIRKNASLILGISIPILLIIFVALSIYLPSIFAEPPKYNFLYSTGSDYYYGPHFIVRGGKLVKEEIAPPPNEPKPLSYPQQRDVKLYFYDVTKDESREVSYEEVKNFNLDSNFRSPDGYEVSRGGRGGDIFSIFGSNSSDYNTVYLKGHNVSKKININLDYNYYYDFLFLGWVK